MSQENLRALFLRRFVGDLINNVKIESSPDSKIEDKKTPEEIEIKKENISGISPVPAKTFVPIKATNLTLTTNQTREKILVTRKRVIQQRKSVPIPLTLPTEGYPELGRLNTLVSDAGVEGVECLGPDKNILVKKGGRVQRTSILLKKEEIQKILRDFSEKTRIPLTKGTFKAVLGNLILTAVLSEFVGTKFILQKKNPVSFQEPL